MKYLIISMLIAFDMLFALPNDNMTDVESPSDYGKEVYDLSTSDYECSLYIEKAGNNLYTMSVAEAKNDKKTVSSEFFIFLKNSDNAIEYCKYISNDVVTDMTNIQEGVKAYYNKEYKKNRK